MEKRYKGQIVFSFNEMVNDLSGSFVNVIETFKENKQKFIERKDYFYIADITKLDEPLRNTLYRANGKKNVYLFTRQGKKKLAEFCEPKYKQMSFEEVIKSTAVQIPQIGENQTISINDAAKLLFPFIKMGEKKLFAALREKGVFYYNRNGKRPENRCKQEYLDNGYFRHIVEKRLDDYNGRYGSYIKIVVTNKGLQAIARWFGKW